MCVSVSECRDLSRIGCISYKKDGAKMAIADNLKAVWEVSLTGTIAAAGGTSVPLAMVFMFRRTSFTNPVSKSEIADAFDTAYMGTLKAAMNNRANISAIKVRCVNDAEDLAHSKTVDHDGAIATDSLPSDSVAVIQLKSAVRGKWAQGRKYFGPLSEADTTGDVLTGDGLTRMQAVRDKMDDGFTDASGNTYVPAVLSRKYSQIASNPTTVVVNDIVSCVLNKNISRLGRRKQRTVN